METLGLYFLKVNLLLIFFSLFYKLFLKNDTFFEWVRYYFLGSMALAFSLPLLYHYKTVETIQEVNYEAVSTSESITKNPVIVESMTDYLTLGNILIGVYTMGCLWMLFRFYKALMQLRKFIKQGHKTQYGARVITHPNITHAFSFAKWIVLPENHATQPDLTTILAHERLHIQQRHSIDIIAVELLHCFFWMNPIMPILKKHLRLNLEYLVDASLTQATPSYEYQRALLHSYAITAHPLTNSFNATDLKKRIIMLNTKKSKNMSKIKFTLAVPFVVVFFMAFQVKTIAQVKFVYNNPTASDARTASTHYLYATDSKENFKKMATSLKKLYKVDLSFTNIQQKNGKIVAFDAVIKEKKKNHVYSFGKKQAFESLELTVEKTDNTGYALVLKDNNNNNAYVYNTSSNKTTRVDQKNKEAQKNKETKSTAYDYKIVTFNNNKGEDAEVKYIINGQTYGAANLPENANIKVYTNPNKKGEGDAHYTSSYTYATNLDKEALIAAKNIIIKDRENQIAIATAVKQAVNQEIAAELLSKELALSSKRVEKALKMIEKTTALEEKKIALILKRAELNIEKQQKRLKDINSQAWEIIESRVPLQSETP